MLTIPHQTDLWRILQTRSPCHRERQPTLAYQFGLDCQVALGHESKYQRVSSIFGCVLRFSPNPSGRLLGLTGSDFFTTIHNL